MLPCKADGGNDGQLRFGSGAPRWHLMHNYRGHLELHAPLNHNMYHVRERVYFNVIRDCSWAFTLPDMSTFAIAVNGYRLVANQQFETTVDSVLINYRTLRCTSDDETMTFAGSDSEDPEL
ncbi:unnamed protein product [Symbiodinium sp. CCMP2592]|nr:unnamed protein product [Symbiodinium sp. CCMP2592]